MLLVGYVFYWFAVCIVDGLVCVLFLVVLHIVVGWQCVMLVGCVYYCWMAVSVVVGWFAYCCSLALCVVGWMFLFLFVVRVNCCWLAVCNIGWPAYCCCLAVCIVVWMCVL